ncbi:MAG: chorismate synthase [Crocinitomicaceae bacterium]|nr:chorismate synthase [Crocinitomicaceae bacterium]
MAGNSIGKIFKLTTFGESHGKAIGGIIDGCPGNVQLNLEEIQKGLDRRKPGQSKITTQRKESDTVKFLSGISETGLTLGTPIGFIIENEDQKSKDYGNLENIYRPSHADYTYQAKYGIREHRGGGRSSARETACRVVGGEIAKQILKFSKVNVNAFVSGVHDISLDLNTELDLSKIDDNIVRCPDALTAERMIECIQKAKKDGDSLGGIVTCFVDGCPVGIGEPVFDRLNAELAKSMFCINAVKGFELGSGFDSVRMKGSEHNDEFVLEEGEITTKTNNSGGIQGGISNGQRINFNVAFKPVATILQKQKTISKDLKEENYQVQGRHDPCVVPRAVPIVEAMAAMVILDNILLQKTTQL